MKTPAPQRAASRKKLAAKGQALPGGTAPVPDVAYLKKAIRAKGRVDPAKWPALKRLIVKRARQLGATSAPGVKGTWPFQGAGEGGPAIELVGPKGYVHGWIYVGGPGLPGVADHDAALRGKGVTPPAKAHPPLARPPGAVKPSPRPVKPPAPVTARSPARPPAVKAVPKKVPASRDYPKMTAKQAEKWGSDGWPSTSPPIPRDQYDALRNYTGAEYKEVNHYLRTGKDGSAETRKSIASLDKALADHPTPSKATVVHRGIDLDAFGNVTPDKLVGHDVREPGFLSTSVGSAVANGFWNHEAHVEIRVPAGTPAFYMEGLTGASGERELLLARGLQYKILAARKDRAGTWHVQAEIVPAAVRALAGDAAGIELVGGEASARIAMARKAGAEGRPADAVNHLTGALRHVADKSAAHHLTELKKEMTARVMGVPYKPKPLPKRLHAMANDDPEAISLSATMTRRMPVVRGAADVQLSRTAPGMITAMHKSSGMKIGTIMPSGKGYAGKHADGTATGSSGSQQGALAGLIAHHNKRARGFPPAQQGGTASYAGDEGAVDLAGSPPFTPAATSPDGPRVTSAGAGKAAAGGPAGLSPYAAGIYRKFLARKMKPAVALGFAKRADAMHGKAAGPKA